MLTLRNEPDEGEVVTLARVHDVDATAPAIPAGELVRIVGLGVDDAGDVALWSVAWHGNEYWCLGALATQVHLACSANAKTSRRPPACSWGRATAPGFVCT